MGVATGSFAAPGQSSAIMGTLVDLVVSGTFTGSIQIETAMPGSGGADVWVATATALTAAGVSQFMAANSRKYRANATALSTGTAYYQLSTSNSEDLMDSFS